jgi:hypothetical protein
MTTPDSQLFTPQDPRLGRHVWHDPRNRDYDAQALLLAAEPPPRLTLWSRLGPIFDQGECPVETLVELGADPTDRSIGCCTNCATFGLLNTEPYARTGRVYTMEDVLPGYHRTTQVDERAVPGVWPPTDTGSTGQHAMKVLVAAGLIQAYRWAFRMRTVLGYLAHGPVAAGTVWYDSMFTPVERDGRLVLEITPDAEVAGGHEWIIDGNDPAHRMVRMTNSWGPRWGRLGRAWVAYDTLERLLGERGDVVVPVLRPKLPGRLRAPGGAQEATETAPPAAESPR